MIKQKLTMNKDKGISLQEIKLKLKKNIKEDSKFV